MNELCSVITLLSTLGADEDAAELGIAHAVDRSDIFDERCVGLSFGTTFMLPNWVPVGTLKPDMMFGCLSFLTRDFQYKKLL
jgi:hypothetical protein